jgi:hypothetical protein
VYVSRSRFIHLHDGKILRASFGEIISMKLRSVWITHEDGISRERVEYGLVRNEVERGMMIPIFKSRTSAGTEVIKGIRLNVISFSDMYIHGIH